MSEFGVIWHQIGIITSIWHHILDHHNFLILTIVAVWEITFVVFMRMTAPRASIVQITNSKLLEEQIWLNAAEKVLHQSGGTLHYTDIRRIILEKKLINSGLKTTLEEALYKEAQRPSKNRVKLVENQQGVFTLARKDSRFIPMMPAPAQVIGHRSQVTVRPQYQSSNQQLKATINGGVNKYVFKYKRLKKHCKQLIFLNAAVCDEVVKLEEKISRVKEERRYLLKKVLQQQAISEVTNPSATKQQQTPTHTGSVTIVTPSRQTSQSIAQLLGEVSKKVKKKSTPPGGGEGKKKVPSPAVAGKTEVKKVSKDSAEDAAKPKQKKVKSQSNKKLLQPIALDDIGRPIFPIELGQLTVHCLGEIVPERTGYHNQEHIFPVGFCSTRVYASVQCPQQMTLYTCKIMDSLGGPQFEISPEDMPNFVLSGGSPFECHAKLLQTINQVAAKDVVPTEAKGEDFFGVSHPTIQNLIQSCPGARRCPSYKWVKFEVSKDGKFYQETEPAVSWEILQQSAAFKKYMVPKSEAGTTPGHLMSLLTTVSQ